MRKLLLGLVVALGVAGIANAKVIISGKAVPLALEGDTYVVTDPNMNFVTSDYYYVAIDSKERVCYKEKVPALVSLDAAFLKFRLGSDTHQVYCYDADPGYFTIQ